MRRMAAIYTAIKRIDPFHVVMGAPWCGKRHYCFNLPSFYCLVCPEPVLATHLSVFRSDQRKLNHETACSLPQGRALERLCLEREWCLW
jgi:hypothetical protein